MANERTLPVSLTGMESFSKNDFISAMEKEYSMGKSQIAYDLQKRLDSGNVIRVGWNKYTVPGKRKLYAHRYTDVAEDIVAKINENYVDLDFQIFELVQLNVFVNHQIAHNTIFVSIENGLQDYVFDTLKEEYPGRVMIRPSLDEYFRYVVDDEIIVLRLPSETPKGIEFPWASRLEKILVDILTDKLVGGIVADGEKENIIREAYESYLLDEGTMVRYAKRKGAVKKFREELDKYEGVSV